MWSSWKIVLKSTNKYIILYCWNKNYKDRIGTFWGKNVPVSGVKRLKTEWIMHNVHTKGYQIFKCSESLAFCNFCAWTMKISVGVGYDERFNFWKSDLRSNKKRYKSFWESLLNSTSFCWVLKYSMQFCPTKLKVVQNGSYTAKIWHNHQMQWNAGFMDKDCRIVKKDNNNMRKSVFVSA